jgi:hypothetical protein
LLYHIPISPINCEPFCCATVFASVCENSFNSVHIIDGLSHPHCKIRLLVSFLLGSYVGISEGSGNQLAPAVLNTYARVRRTRSKASSGDGKRFDLMVYQWPTDNPPSRHRWGVSKCFSSRQGVVIFTLWCVLIDGVSFPKLCGEKWYDIYQIYSVRLSERE